MEVTTSLNLCSSEQRSPRDLSQEVTENRNKNQSIDIVHVFDRQRNISPFAKIEERLLLIHEHLASKHADIE